MNIDLKPCALCGGLPEYLDLDRLSPWHLNAPVMYWCCPACKFESEPPNLFRDHYDWGRRHPERKALVWNAWQDILREHRPANREELEKESLPCAACGKMPGWENLDSFHPVQANGLGNMWICPVCGEESVPSHDERNRFGGMDDMAKLLKVWNWHQAQRATAPALEKLLDELGKGRVVFVWKDAQPALDPAPEEGLLVSLADDKSALVFGNGEGGFGLDAFREGLFFLSQMDDGSFTVSLNDHDIDCPVVKPVVLGSIQIL